MNRHNRSVAEGTSRFRIVENRGTQFSAVVGEKQGAKITPRYPQQTGREHLDQTAKVQLGRYAVGNFQNQAQAVAFKPQLLFIDVTLNGDSRNVTGILD